MANSKGKRAKTTTAESVQPDQQQDVTDVTGEVTGDIEVKGHISGGTLAIRADQTEWDPVQREGLAAIGIPTTGPDAFPAGQIVAFLHLCQKRGLDPFAREAYLIARGNGDNRKFTMQVGIDGYRKNAQETGRFIRRVGVYWTGTDDDQRSWRWDETEEVMKRVWFDQWPAARANPGSAKCVLEHYDEAGNVVRTEAIADWDMYAPLYEKWAWNAQQRKKLPVLDEHGKKIMELGEMWAKGGPHMLAKCLPGRTRIQTDRGSLTIREIVNGRLPVQVRSVDLTTGEECMRPVVNWYRNPSTRDWVRVWTPNGNRGNRAIRLTPDHPMWTPTGWRDAGDLAPGDLVAVTSPTLSAEQDQVILGGLLGDGTLSGRKRPSSLPHYAESHSVAQEGYLRWKAAALANLGTTVTGVDQSDGKGGVHPTMTMRTRAVPALYHYRGMKPTERLGDLGDLGVAVWLMDDGSIKSTGHGSPNPYVRIYCCGFGADFADDAVEFFRARYGVTAKVCRREKNPYLWIGAADTAVLLARLSKYIRYDAAINTKVWVAGDVEQGSSAGIAFVPVLRAEAVETRKAEVRYDIEVEDTHTFVVNNTVVSNCAEALAYRVAFPAQTSGMYIAEEMHRLDAEERQREDAEQRRLRREAMQAARENATKVKSERADRPSSPAPAQRRPDPSEQTPEPAAGTGEASVSDDTGWTSGSEAEPETERLTRQQAVAELTWWAENVFDKVLAVYLARPMSALGVSSVDEIPDSMMIDLVERWRDHTAKGLEQLHNPPRTREAAMLRNGVLLHLATDDADSPAA